MANPINSLRFFYQVIMCCVVSFLFLLPSAQAQNIEQRYHELNDLIQKNPQDLSLKIALAQLFTQGMNYDEAKKIYFEILEQDGKYLAAIVDLCALLTQQREVEQAEKWCKKWVEIEPHQAFAHDNLGLFYFNTGQMLKALPCFAKAMELKPDGVLIKNHIAQVYLALREYELARDLYQKLIPLETNEHDRAYLYHGLWLAQKGLKNYDEALDAILVTSRLSGNPLFYGKVVSTFIAAHQLFFFCIVSGVLLLACWYFGKRLNRFLKNED